MAVRFEMQSIKAMFETAEVCGHRYQREVLPVQPALLCGVWSQPCCDLSCAHHASSDPPWWCSPPSPVGITGCVLLYGPAVKCCCGFCLQLTFTVRFVFWCVWVWGAPASPTAWRCLCPNPAPCGTCFSLSRRDSQQGKACVGNLSSFDGDGILWCVCNCISDIAVHSGAVAAGKSYQSVSYLSCHHDLIITSIFPLHLQWSNTERSRYGIPTLESKYWFFSLALVMLSYMGCFETKDFNWLEVHVHCWELIVPHSLALISVLLLFLLFSSPVMPHFLWNFLIAHFCRNLRLHLQKIQYLTLEQGTSVAYKPSTPHIAMPVHWHSWFRLTHVAVQSSSCCTNGTLHFPDPTLGYQLALFLPPDPSLHADPYPKFLKCQANLLETLK